LVGWNGTSANITNSSFDGELYGETKVGGITGYNAGTVLSSRNKSNVMNDTCEEINRDHIHIGGIAGVNVGVIEDSENMGNIGYPSNGYNIGGIAGRQKGYITNARNYGKVYGGEEVGGIVGKMEPYENLIIPPSKLEQLEDEIVILEDVITRIISNTGTSSDLIGGNLSQLEGSIGRSRTNIQSLVNQWEQGLDSIDAYLRAKEDLFGSMNDLSTSICELNTTMDAQSNHLVEDMEIVNEGFYNITDLLVGIIEELNAGELEPEDIIMDVSSEAAGNSTEGIVSESKNYGDIG